MCYLSMTLKTSPPLASEAGTGRFKKPFGSALDAVKTSKVVAILYMRAHIFH